MELMKSKDSHG